MIVAGLCAMAALAAQYGGPVGGGVLAGLMAMTLIPRQR